MRKIKFKVWNIPTKQIIFLSECSDITLLDRRNWEMKHNVFMQFTGLLDRNGKEIYELMEINNKYRIEYIAPRYVLTDISNGDIIDIDNNNLHQYEITREYSPL